MNVSRAAGIAFVVLSTFATCVVTYKPIEPRCEDVHPVDDEDELAFDEDNCIPSAPETAWRSTPTRTPLP